VRFLDCICFHSIADHVTLILRMVNSPKLASYLLLQYESVTLCHYYSKMILRHCVLCSDDELCSGFYSSIVFLSLV